MVSGFPSSRPFDDLEVIATLGVGGFGRVELVRTWFWNKRFFGSACQCLLCFSCYNKWKILFWNGSTYLVTSQPVISICRWRCRTRTSHLHWRSSRRSMLWTTGRKSTSTRRGRSSLRLARLSLSSQSSCSDSKRISIFCPTWWSAAPVVWENGVLLISFLCDHSWGPEQITSCQRGRMAGDIEMSATKM